MFLFSTTQPDIHAHFHNHNIIYENHNNMRLLLLHIVYINFVTDIGKKNTNFMNNEISVNLHKNYFYMFHLNETSFKSNTSSIFHISTELYRIDVCYF